MSRFNKSLVLGALALLGSARIATAQTATQTVSFQVQKVNVIAVAAGTPTLTITTAVPGSPLTQATASSSYDLTSNDSLAKITIQIASNMPSGVTLGVTLGTVTGSTSAGALVLTSVAQDAVTGITKVMGSGKSIAYTLDATLAAGVVASDTRLVTRPSAAP